MRAQLYMIKEKNRQNQESMWSEDTQLPGNRSRNLKIGPSACPFPSVSFWHMAFSAKTALTHLRLLLLWGPRDGALPSFSPHPRQGISLLGEALESLGLRPHHTTHSPILLDVCWVATVLLNKENESLWKFPSWNSKVGETFTNLVIYFFIV